MDEDIRTSNGQRVPTLDGHILLVFSCIALYNVIELIYIIWITFKRHSGIYFWTFIIATLGILVHAIGFILKAFGPENGVYIYVSLISVGWVAMVTGQSLVLWSRLYLIVHAKFRLKAILWMIIINGIIFHIPIIVMLYGANGPNSQQWDRVFGIYEKVQVTGFFLQEVIISLFYIYETMKLSKLRVMIENESRSRFLKQHLIVVHIVIILLDITILGLEYSNKYNIQTSYKAFVYSVKLKLEFNILNKLVEMATGNSKISSGKLKYGLKSAVTGGIELNETTVRGGTADRSRHDRNSSYGYHAHAYRGDDGDRPTNDSERVLKFTREIRITERRKSVSNSVTEATSASQGERSASGTGFERSSKASSELHLASGGF
ncbi:unnamed protein product [Clonostachys byssicola]|uniref:DUF7703 domain-containing protein n=1 Tax=Clonostachys byssicola TaxID=160290 RepID=A0A9N9UMK5_9HYPO|nr:unnamed protein product [Clonostachys byssicola]